MLFRVNNVIQSGLFIKWKQVYWAEQFRNIKIEINQQNKLSEDILTLNQVSISFYILLCCLPFSIAALLIENLVFKLCITY